jgi:hypothetical protein
MAILVNDHEKLHHAVARATLAGGGAVLAAGFLPPALGTALVALALAVAVVPPATWMSAATALLWACAAGGAGQIGGTIGTVGMGLAIGGSLARGTEGARRWVAAGFGVVGALGMALLRTGLENSALAVLPSGVEALAIGAASGLMVGVSSIGRHISRLAPAVESELESLGSDGELGQLLGRAASAYRDAVEAMGDDAPQARLAADDLVKRMARFGRHWREVEAEAARSLPEELHERLALLTRRLESTEDPLARVEFERAQQAMTAQLDYLQEINRGRERAVARLTHQVATLERLRLAAVRHRSVDAARLGAELQPVVEELSQAGTDLDIASEALSEAVVAGALPAASIRH